ncbi:MAG: NfeD family protein [Yaniella sp.]|uniref:NfeD family protein n=1 Tax=Yaniella sp. TaxID=2773929 RepID=UPI0026477237|nr:NfeD family protein [Yaniella sp.]MDN5730638.1 NfeD family protein [Yaniella sp.]MDN5815431.1 NfeD family protein [Yaniella sp.]MDN5818233.1 NfeD family protein [Yaniella sp.]MDN5837216.1 NfeD family protein [Yaniella sp.]MDN5889224.1 NfeD family protein [Yaniella sp.]
MMLEWILENFWSFWLIMMLLLISVQVMTGEMTFLLISAGALTAVIADVLGAPIYVQFIIVTVISIASLIWLRSFDTKRPENDSGPSPWSVNRYVGRVGDVTEEVTTSQGRVRIGNEIWSARTYSTTPIPMETPVVIQQIEGAIVWVATTPESFES